MIYSALPFIVAFVVCLVLCPIGIPILRRLKAGNTEREELKSHQVKNGTPSMGGIFILIAVVVASLIFARWNYDTIPHILLMVGFGVIGFIDDFLKVVLKRSDGLIAWQKMLLQIVVTVIFMIWYFLHYAGATNLHIPFTLLHVQAPIIYALVMFLAILGTVNGVNFTDGVDGLASTVTLIVAIFFVFVRRMMFAELDVVSLTVIGALMAFLIFNCYPAKVFMGDTGSLALGGFVAGCGYLLNEPFIMVIVGLVYWAEILSVMIQVSYFKATKGKRVFRMAPIHHHFELGGWSEVKVVTVFSIITVFLCAVGYVALRL
ncbi:phospho-N-acetylmuramoyl-pentapeptide-transferase [Eubacterium oxidoreducens]|uniref:Phospho-N-acetylmuramoyl-pentapeptide-transferase n=1 Tax=Eubacterium oxidoreducens TaxID=1732 RepID=A0A1G6AFP2_EUBOX|nr:phospho-N-acetylmuramoyl-pentapeptide-transferase [Eubacterium oxidoreducens]SDB07231.1 Phospho-N-acetylmuramoyl-pentapeptide-transferase [Eubacterium oxidoreducens]